MRRGALACLAALKDPTQKNDRDHVDIIIALGMAKEGFDWIWCEHALTIGYRSSLTEIVQIIGRATRDAKGKERARFTNLIAEPAVDEAVVIDAVNDTLKAIAASLLMEQVLAPRFEFTPKHSGPQEGFDYGPQGYWTDAAKRGRQRRNGPGARRDQRAGDAAERRRRRASVGRPERGHYRVRAGRADAGARPLRQGEHLAGRADPTPHGKDRARTLSGAERGRPGSHSPARGCCVEYCSTGQAGAGQR
jgi:hypothetical protein